MAVSALELRPRSALALLDAALRLCARNTGVWALTLPGGVAVIAAVLYVVEEARLGHPLFVPALALTAAWYLRGLCQGAATHHVQALLLDGAAEPSIGASVKAALQRLPGLLVAVGYLFAFNWLVLLLTLGIGFFLFAAQGVGYAVVMQGRGRLLGLYGLCTRQLGPARGTALQVRLLMAVQVLVFVNLHAGANFLLFLLRKLVGIDLTFAERFASLDSPPWLLFLASLTFALFEPVRAATATLLLVDGRVRQEGLDLLAAVQQLPARNTGKPLGSRHAAGLALVLVAGALLTAPPARADDTPARPPVASGKDAAKRLEAVTTACSDEEHPPTRDARLDVLGELGPAEQGKLQRLVRAVERTAYDEEDCDAAMSLLEHGLVQGAATAGPSSGTDARAASSRARDILARAEFAVAPPKEVAPKEEAPPPEVPGWFRRFLDWLGELLKKLFERDAAPEPSDPSSSFVSANTVANVLVMLLVTATLVLLGVVLIRVLGGPRKARAQEALEVATLDTRRLAGDPMHALSRPPEGWAHLADELAAKGQYREAVRSLYLALLSRLHRDGAILYDVTLSNWDYLRQFKGRAEWKPRFRELTLRFDFAWYGNTPVGSAGYQEFRTLTAPMLAAAPTPEAAGA
ncbi:DUF4129 domain-containing protein [Myxococcus sp. K15C18031901]|uniref:DUF4129 domain-containing protein n=1 Tax=Myxococcus dinghuensis TaxID=2906761 RepID=UPI0020A6F88F|nr:DUF4129 domain-containing protein [Myxococcus dinghuensis]MCP3097648.1 DUF4129 domain-containing protein [Myxococcus dinghuensis]